MINSVFFRYYLGIYEKKKKKRQLWFYYRLFNNNLILVILDSMICQSNLNYKEEDQLSMNGGQKGKENPCRLWVIEKHYYK